MFRFWHLNQDNPAAPSVSKLQHGEYQFDLRNLPVGADADANKVILDLGNCLTWLGVRQASHAELVALLIEDIGNGFLDDISLIDLRCWPRQNVIMDIVEARGLAEHLVLENAVRMAVGMDVVGQEIEWVRWWETVGIGVPEPSLIAGDQFVEGVEYIMFVRSLEMQEQRLSVQDDLDEVMESMEVSGRRGSVLCNLQ